MHRRLALLCCLLAPLLAPAQSQPDCTQMLRDGDALMTRRDPPLEEALRCYLNALNCNSQLAGMVGPKVQGVFEAIKAQKEREQRATRQAQAEATHARKEQEKAEKAVWTTYANDLAYKSQTALHDGDRTTAFRLAELAYRYVDSDNLNVTHALVEAIYYNDNPTHQPLPWASNLEGHTDAVSSVAFSPDGQKLATASFDHTVKIWDLATGKAALTLKDHGSDLTSITFSPDGKKLATASFDHTAKIWDLLTGRITLTLEGFDDNIWSVAFSPDGKKLATASADHSAKIWDQETGKVTQTLRHPDIVQYVAFSPDGKKLATTASDHTANIWDLETGKVSLTLTGHTDQVIGVAFSPDGKKLATASVDHTAKIWDAETGKSILTLQGHRATIESVAFSPDGTQLATASDDNTAKIWNLETGHDTLTLQGHTDIVFSVAFSPDGKRLATGSADQTAKIWDLNIHKAPPASRFFFARNGVNSLSFSPDGKKLATASADSTAKIWDLQTGKPTLTLKDLTSSVKLVSFSPDGKKLATAASDSTAKIWNLETGQVALTLRNYSGSIKSMAFSPDGKKLATAASDSTAKIWNLETGKNDLTLRGHMGIVHSVAFSSDGNRLATSSEDKTAKIWNLETGKVTRNLEDMYPILMVAFSPDGKKLATAGGFTAKIWELDTPPPAGQVGEAALTLQGHVNIVHTVAFSPDGKKLATASKDQTTKIWDLETGRTLLTFYQPVPDNSVAFSPDGKKLATGSYSKTARIWELTPEGWQASPEASPHLAGLTYEQLGSYHLDGLLDIHPDNEAILQQTGSCGQLLAFAKLYAEKTWSSHDLRRTAPNYARAIRLYDYALRTGGDSSLITQLGSLYWSWADQILASNRPDTAARYIELSCQLTPDKRYLGSSLGGYFGSPCNNLWARFSEKTGGINNLLKSEDGEALSDYGNYFFQKEKWSEAKQFYEQAESKAHSAVILEKLFTIAENTGETFDFQRFMKRVDANELEQYATFFIEKAEAIEANRDKVPDYQNALRIRDRQLRFDTTADTRATVANEYLNLSFCQLFVPDGVGAEASIRQALALDSNNVYIHRYLAPARLLQGRFEAAKTGYLQWGPKPFDENDLPTYRDAFLADFKAFRDANVFLPRMEEIEVLLKAMDIKPDPPH